MGEPARTCVAVSIMLVVLPDVVDDFAVVGQRARGVKCDVSAQVANVTQRDRNGGGEHWIAGAGDFNLGLNELVVHSGKVSGLILQGITLPGDP